MWFLILMLIHCVHSRPNYDNPLFNTKHCIKMSAAKDREITTILAEFTDFLNKIADEHDGIDIPFINIHIENHSDDESEEKDTKLRVVINDCHDFVDEDDNYKINVDRELKEVTNKNLKANKTTYQDMPAYETLLKDIENLTKENDKLKYLLDRYNKSSRGRETEERKLKFINNNEEFLLSDTDSKVINETITSIGNSEDNIEEKITVTDKNVQNIFKTNNNLSLNSSELNDEPRINKIIGKFKLNYNETQAKLLANAMKIAKDISLSETEAEVNILAKINHWKDKFMKVIEKVLEETVSNIEFIEDNNNETGTDVFTDNLYKEKSNINYVKFNSDNEKDVSIKQNYNSSTNKNNVKIYDNEVDRKEKYISNIQHTALVDITENKYYNQPTNANNDDYTYHKDVNFNTNTKSEQNALKEKNKLVPYLEDSEFKNSIYKTDTEIDKEVSNRESAARITYLDNADKYAVNNLDTKERTKIDCVESIDNKRVILEDTDNLQINVPDINNADIIAVNIDTVVDENIPHSDKQEEFNPLLSTNQNKSSDEAIIPVNEPISCDNTNNNSAKISYDEAILNENKQHTEINTTENKAIDAEDLTKDSELSSIKTTEETIAIEQNLPEVLPLSLEENGEEFLQIIERETDKSKPLWVYIQENKGQNDYVFLTKK